MAPAHHDTSDDIIKLSQFAIEDAQVVYARQHGFESWNVFADYLRDLPATPVREPFLTVFEAAKRNNWQAAMATLSAHPDVVRAFGTNGNTLLNLAASLLACPTPAALQSGHSRDDRLAPMRLLLGLGLTQVRRMIAAGRRYIRQHIE